MYSKRRSLISFIKSINIKGTGKLSSLLSTLLIPKPTGELIIDTIYNFKLKIDPVKDNGVERNLYYFRTYEKGTLHIMGKLLNQGDYFVDVGANIGLMTIYGSTLVGKEGKVIGFEPNPVTRKILKENVELNKCENVTVEKLAVGSECKSSKIYDRWDVNRGGASLIKPDFETDSYEIEETTLTDYFTNKQDIKLMKIDVEGYELEVLKGGTALFKSDKAPIIIMEVSLKRKNSFGQGVYPLYEFVHRTKNYRVFKSTKGKERISKLVEILDETQLPGHDNVYCFTNKHLTSATKELFKTPPF